MDRPTHSHRTWSLAAQLPILSATLLVAATFFVSEGAWACAVCGIGEDESTGAFMISTAMLTFTPLTVMGVIGYYLYRRFNPEAPRLGDAIKGLFQAEQTAPVRSTKGSAKR